MAPLQRRADRLISRKEGRRAFDDQSEIAFRGFWDVEDRMLTTERAPAVLSPRELVQGNIPLVEHIVNRVAVRFPRGVDRDELVQVAMVGLVEAARRFDASRGFAFSTYAGRRIEGAILDSLRSACWAPRSVRANQRQIDAAERTLQARLQRSASEEELAAELGVEVEQLAAWRASVARGVVVSLDEQRASRSTDSLADTRPSTEDLIERRELRDRVRACIGMLPERHRYVIVGHLLEDRPMHELADQLGVTRSRASQLKSEAINLLRSAVDGRATARTAVDGRAMANRARTVA
jgi:RNA polymerase sigma factor for flagellar operon FliA